MEVYSQEFQLKKLKANRKPLTENLSQGGPGEKNTARCCKTRVNNTQEDQEEKTGFYSEKENIQYANDCDSSSSCPSFVAGSLCWLPWETYKNNKIQGRSFKGVKNKGRENH